jgi:hypothetical protein
MRPHVHDSCWRAVSALIDQVIEHRLDAEYGKLGYSSEIHLGKFKRTLCARAGTSSHELSHASVEHTLQLRQHSCKGQ